MESETELGKGRLRATTGQVMDDADGVGGAAAGEASSSQRRMFRAAGAAALRRLIEIRHVDGAATVCRDRPARCAGGMDIPMRQARRRDARLRQHAMFAHFICAGVSEVIGKTACMHGLDAAVAPAHRTLTWANARRGATDCRAIASTTRSQRMLCARRLMTRIFYRSFFVS
ncbi:hypothetical protein CCAX7_30950 [Capsulimonas corticalis]|uniref:Uncharacterized protein n=1 Tax=Capsulimonas corticalis TaxID=2219043 RepID=A0A402CSK7_9BACT|nr:hypothetical protein CCAX7_30950 [Capsulimonas corticalis]